MDLHALQAVDSESKLLIQKWSLPSEQLLP